MVAAVVKPEPGVETEAWQRHSAAGSSMSWGGTPSRDAHASGSMIKADADTPSSSGTGGSTSQSRKSLILGPDGVTLYTQGEAAKLGLLIRAACQACRERKLKCDGRSSALGGCLRCEKAAVACRYEARNPIGRPKKRKAEDQDGGLPQRMMASASLPGGIGGGSSMIARPYFPSATSSSPASLSPASSAVLSGASPSIQATHAMQKVQMGSPESYGSLNTYDMNYAPVNATPTPTGGGVDPNMKDGQPPGTGGSSRDDSPSVPSLNDLSIAAFLQSLDTLEIAAPQNLFVPAPNGPADAPEQGPEMPSSSTQMGTTWTAGQTHATESISQLASNSAQASTSTLGGWFDGQMAGSAILDPNISYAVPADFSWWDIAGLGNELGFGTYVNYTGQQAGPASVAAQNGSPQIKISPHSDARSHQGSSAAVTESDSTKTLQNAPTNSPKWPRGKAGGMGSGKLICDGVTYEAEDWVSRGGLPEVAQESAAESLSPPDVKDCCSGSKKQPEGALDILTTETSPPSCCSTKAPTNAEADAPAKSCCASKGKAQSSAQQATLEPRLSANDRTSVAPAEPVNENTKGKKKVYCVPNPNGKGCTCLCDMSVALISVRKTLRAASAAAGELEEQQQPEAAADGAGTSSCCGTKEVQKGPAKPPPSNANVTLQLTLTASQAVAAHCACSAECPTCRMDPSTQMTASLLVSTALQIYARAIKTLKEGVGSALGVMAGSSSSAVSNRDILDVKIGDWRPSEANARKIALYAMRLELKDLRKALAKVAEMAKGTTRRAGPSTDQGSDSQRDKPLLNTIDQLVIEKLYQQLGEILETVIAE